MNVSGSDIGEVPPACQFPCVRACWAPIDKLSLPLTVLFAFLLLHEQMTWRLGVGVGLMVAGALLTLK